MNSKPYKFEITEKNFNYTIQKFNDKVHIRAKSEIDKRAWNVLIDEDLEKDIKLKTNVIYEILEKYHKKRDKVKNFVVIDFPNNPKDKEGNLIIVITTLSFCEDLQTSHQIILSPENINDIERLEERIAELRKRCFTNEKSINKNESAIQKNELDLLALLKELDRFEKDYNVNKHKLVLFEKRFEILENKYGIIWDDNIIDDINAGTKEKIVNKNDPDEDKLNDISGSINFTKEEIDNISASSNISIDKGITHPLQAEAEDILTSDDDTFSYENLDGSCSSSYNTDTGFGFDTIPVNSYENKELLCKYKSFNKSTSIDNMNKKDLSSSPSKTNSSERNISKSLNNSSFINNINFKDVNFKTIKDNFNKINKNNDILNKKANDNTASYKSLNNEFKSHASSTDKVLDKLINGQSLMNEKYEDVLTIIAKHTELITKSSENIKYINQFVKEMKDFQRTVQGELNGIHLDINKINKSGLYSKQSIDKIGSKLEKLAENLNHNFAEANTAIRDGLFHSTSKSWTKN